MTRWLTILLVALCGVAFANLPHQHDANVGQASRLSWGYNTYDPAGNRVGFTSGTNSTELVVNPNAKLPQVLMRIKNGVTNYYIYGAGLLYQVTETATATNTLTYHYDYRGSTITLTADNGIVTDRIEYSLYGSMTYRVGTDDTPFLFNGRYGVMTDPNGLLYMRARYYNPYLCRFINPDPSGFAGGLNFFAYANGNPVSYLDPFGLGAAEAATGSSWVSQALAGTAAGDWVQGFSSGLQSFASGENLSRYTPTGSSAYQSGVTSGYNAVPSAVELAVLLMTIPTGGAAPEAEALLGVEGTAADTGVQIGYHATNPGNIESILANGFNESLAGRLGGGGVYVNNTAEGAIAEYMSVPGRSAPTVLRVQYTPGLNYRINPPPARYTTGPLPLRADTLTTESIRLPGTFNTIIRNGSATVIPSP
jgi:RHS repeat-associated protein